MKRYFLPLSALLLAAFLAVHAQPGVQVSGTPPMPSTAQISGLQQYVQQLVSPQITAMLGSYATQSFVQAQVANAQSQVAQQIQAQVQAQVQTQVQSQVQAAVAALQGSVQGSGGDNWLSYGPGAGLTGTVDGNNAVFGVPVVAKKVECFLNGIRLYQQTDVAAGKAWHYSWSVSPGTGTTAITFTSGLTAAGQPIAIPQPGDSLVCNVAR